MVERLVLPSQCCWRQEWWLVPPVTQAGKPRLKPEGEGWQPVLPRGLGEYHSFSLHLPSSMGLGVGAHGSQPSSRSTSLGHVSLLLDGAWAAGPSWVIDLCRSDVTAVSEEDGEPGARVSWDEVQGGSGRGGVWGWVGGRRQQGSCGHAGLAGCCGPQLLFSHYSLGQIWLGHAQPG